MSKLHIRKIIALSMTFIFGIIAVVGFFRDKVTFAEVLPVVTMVIGYYFGKSTMGEGVEKSNGV